MVAEELHLCPRTVADDAIVATRAGVGELSEELIVFAELVEEETALRRGLGGAHERPVTLAISDLDSLPTLLDALTEAGIVPKDAEWLARMDDKDYAKFLELIDSEGGSDTDNMLISAFKLISGLLGPDKNAFKDAKVAGGVR